MQKRAQSGSPSAPYRLAALRGFFARGGSHQSVTNKVFGSHSGSLRTKNLKQDATRRYLLTEQPCAFCDGIHSDIHASAVKLLHDCFFRNLFSMFFVAALSRRSALIAVALFLRNASVFFAFLGLWPWTVECSPGPLARGVFSRERNGCM